MTYFVRRSLLAQLLSVYLVFVVVVLIGGTMVNTLVEQQLQHDALASDQALAQDIALDTSLQIQSAKSALVTLGKLTAQATTPDEVTHLLESFQATRNNIDYAYWLDAVGVLRASWPPNKAMLGAEFSPPDVIQRARMATDPVAEVGIAVESSLNAGVILAEPVRTRQGELIGIVAINLSLVELSAPLTTVVQAQQQQGRHLRISIIDGNGVLVATPDHKRILQTVLDELPGAEQALHGQTILRVARETDGQDWLFSALPVSHVGWAVVVQMPANEALVIIQQFHVWLWDVALLFALGGLLFWSLLMFRVIRPLHALASQHQALPATEEPVETAASALAMRRDEVGDLARSLARLERDGLAKLGELRTLLETSNAVVGSLEPYAVVGKIIHEVRRLVDVQAAAVLLPDEQNNLRVLVSEGHSKRYDYNLSLSSDNLQSAPVLALRDGKPVQKLLTAQQSEYAYIEGYRTALAIPIISHHAGGVVLLVHRTEAQLFNRNEIDLLLTFANYATLAWEHAILYERSDERLREIAHENEQLYHQASEERQKLAAIMKSMQDGLILTGNDGEILYANPGASALIGSQDDNLAHHSIDDLYTALRTIAVDGPECEQELNRIATAASSESTFVIKQNHRRRVINLHIFAVNDEWEQPLGRGLLLRDVTRERDLDEFKTTLLAAVGHELRTPLSVIKGYASTLLQDDVTWSQEDQNTFLDTISSEADRLAQLVSNLLDLSRQEAGLLRLNTQPTNIYDLVTATVARMKLAHACISVQVPLDLPPAHIDQARIEVVLHNLIMNAQHYGDGKVQIRASRRDKELVVSVTNNGSGIAPDDLPHIFERFYRARHSRQRHSEGTGLGLAISKAFIEAHNCIIWTESGEQDTTILFSLPLFCTSSDDNTLNPSMVTTQKEQR